MSIKPHAPRSSGKAIGTMPQFLLGCNSGVHRVEPPPFILQILDAIYYDDRRLQVHVADTPGTGLSIAVTNVLRLPQVNTAVGRESVRCPTFIPTRNPVVANCQK